MEVSASVSDLVNAAVREALMEDADDLQAFRDREKEPVMDFETFVSELKQNGTL